MTQPPEHDTMTLAGLAAANSPWLAARLSRLAEQAGLDLSPEVVEHAVLGTSRVLREVMHAEGRPQFVMDEASDPVVVLGREQAQAQRQAGLSMPVSLKVQRLLRRAYDDLVRESWVEKGSRARAHEDVERFFERALIGLVATWTGQEVSAPAPKPDEELTKLVARREDDLRRAMAAVQQLTQALRQSRERVDALAAELAQARARLNDGPGMREHLAQLKNQATQTLAGIKAEYAQALAQAQADNKTLSARLAELQAGAPPQAAGAADEALRAELRALREAHATLASEAEAMRARLAETGSRMAEARRAEEGDAQAKLAQARARIAELETQLRTPPRP